MRTLRNNAADGKRDHLPSVLDDQSHRIHCADDTLRAGPLPDARSDLEISSEFANIRVLRTPDSPLDETVAPERPPSIHDIFRHTAGFSHGLTTNALDTQYPKSTVLVLRAARR